MYVLDEWTVDTYTIYRVQTNKIHDVYYTYTIDGSDIRKRSVNHLFYTIEHAMASAIAEKHNGQQGASGTAVGTAADWFMKMCSIDIDKR